MFTHYVIISTNPMAWVSCRCAATRTHHKGQERGFVPRSFFKTLRINQGATK